MEEQTQCKVTQESPQHLAAELNRLGRDGWKPVTMAFDPRTGWVIVIVEKPATRI